MNRATAAFLLLALALASCNRDPSTAIDSRALTRLAANNGPDSEGLFIPGWTEQRCFDARDQWDPDHDTMDNRCEDALAAAFAPGLQVAVDCNFDPSVDRQGGEYYYAVQAEPEARVRIAYLPAYYWDCGSPTEGPPLPIIGDLCPGLGCFGGGHDGDSEFFIVDVQFDATTKRWVTHQIFLSAHCGTPTGQFCMWYPDPTATTPVPSGMPAQPFSWIDGIMRGAPIIWVADGKHANYSSREDCDRGGLEGSETCDNNDQFYRFPVRFSEQNIWSRAIPQQPCVGASLWGSDRVAPGATECFWPRRTFFGWQGLDLIGSTAYSDILAQYAGW